jgi:hypothetical protein
LSFIDPEGPGPLILAHYFSGGGFLCPTCVYNAISNQLDPFAGKGKTEGGAPAITNSNYARWSAWGANNPSPMKATPMMAIPPASQASSTVPVMTAAEHSTMPIWNAAEASS